MNIGALRTLVEKRRSIRGYDESRAPPRRALDEILHYETYDMSKFRSDEQMAGFVKTRTLLGGYGRKGGAQDEQD